MNWNRYKSILILLVIKFGRILPDKVYIRIMYRLRMGRKLDLKNPKTFSEKLQWLKLYDRKPIYTTMVDKYAVKQYVAEKIGKEYVIPTLGVWNTVEEIEWDKLPNQFVLKVTHDSGGVVICKDKTTFDIAYAKLVLRKALKHDYYYSHREWPYKNVKKRVIAEKYMEDTKNKDLLDYKLFCFNGIPKYCQVISDRNTTMSIDFYDALWEHQPFHEPRIYPFSKTPHEVPLNYTKMMELASMLSKGFRFLRVDFYEINGKIYFGELTFYPTSGMGGFDPKEYDSLFGELIVL